MCARELMYMLWQAICNSVDKSIIPAKPTPSLHLDREKGVGYIEFLYPNGEKKECALRPGTKTAFCVYTLDGQEMKSEVPNLLLTPVTRPLKRPSAAGKASKDGSDYGEGSESEADPKQKTKKKDEGKKKKKQPKKAMKKKKDKTRKEAKEVESGCSQASKKEEPEDCTHTHTHCTQLATPSALSCTGGCFTILL